VNQNQMVTRHKRFMCLYVKLEEEVGYTNDWMMGERGRRDLKREGKNPHIATVRGEKEFSRVSCTSHFSLLERQNGNVFAFGERDI